MRDALSFFIRFCNQALIFSLIYYKISRKGDDLMKKETQLFARRKRHAGD